MTLEEIKKTGDKKAILKYRTQCAKDSVKEYREQMRDATPEEQEAVDRYIKSISKPTGINVFDFYEDEEKSCNNCKHHLKFMCKKWETCHDYSDWELNELDFVQPKKSIPCTVKIQEQADGDCNTCEYNTTQDSGECYECAKGIRNHYRQADNDLTTALCSLPKIQSSDGQDYVQLYDVLETVRRYLGDCISKTEAIKTIQQHGVGCFDVDDFTPEQCERYVIKLLQDLKPSVAIPPDHNGCKDCKYETYPDYYYPCCDCKQNYIDKWERVKHWIHRNDDYNDWLECPNCGYGSEGEVKYGEGTPYCPYCGERLEEK